MLTYNLSQRENESKYYYIYKMIRRDIELGNLKKNDKLPSKRSLAEHLGVSLITVENAYQMLKVEGYIEPRERSGYSARSRQSFRLDQRPRSLRCCRRWRSRLRMGV
jgi:GntR family transcriptional regulator/MocR family aminotransferase